MTRKKEKSTFELNPFVHLKKAKKSDLKIFTTNLLAIVLSIFFMRRYVENDHPILPMLGVVSVSLILIVVFSHFKTKGKERLFPELSMVVLNVGMSAILCIFFFIEIKLLGSITVMVFSALLSEVEHLLHEVRR